MTTEEREALRLVVGEAIDNKLQPICKDIDSIKVKLNNHIEHLAYDFTAVKNDVSWLKQFFDPKSEIERDTKNSAEIGWLKWATRLLIAGVIGEALAIIFGIFIKK